MELKLQNKQGILPNHFSTQERWVDCASSDFFQVSRRGRVYFPRVRIWSFYEDLQKSVKLKDKTEVKAACTKW